MLTSNSPVFSESKDQGVNAFFKTITKAMPPTTSLKNPSFNQVSIK
jgi:hypothetical protein